MTTDVHVSATEFSTARLLLHNAAGKKLVSIRGRKDVQGWRRAGDDVIPGAGMKNVLQGSGSQVRM